MKLFVWEGDGVLTDYTSGMIIAVAPDLESAHRLVIASMPHAAGNYPAIPTKTVELGEGCPAPAEAWACWGGG